MLLGRKLFALIVLKVCENVINLILYITILFYRVEMSAQDEVSRIAFVFEAIGNPVRFRILTLVSETERPLHIKAVAKILKMDYGTVYRHVKILKKSGLLEIYEVGRSRVLRSKNAEVIRQMVELAKTI